MLLIALLPRFGVGAGGVLAGVVFGGYLAAAVYFFRAEGLWLNLVYPSLLIALLFVSTTLVLYFFRVSEQRYLKRAFAYYVPPPWSTTSWPMPPNCSSAARSAS